MSNIERMIESLISDRVKPLEREIRELRSIIESGGSDNEYLTSSDIQSRYKISRTTLWRHCKNNVLRKYNIGGVTRYKRLEVEELIRSY